MRVWKRLAKAPLIALVASLISLGALILLDGTYGGNWGVDPMLFRCRPPSLWATPSAWLSPIRGLAFVCSATGAAALALSVLLEVVRRGQPSQGRDLGAIVMAVTVSVCVFSFVACLLGAPRMLLALQTIPQVVADRLAGRSIERFRSVPGGGEVRVLAEGAETTAACLLCNAVCAPPLAFFIASLRRVTRGMGAVVCLLAPQSSLIFVLCVLSPILEDAYSPFPSSPNPSLRAAGFTAFYSAVLFAAYLHSGPTPSTEDSA